MHIMDVLVQSAAVYSLALLVAAIVATIFATSGDIATVPMYAVLNYEANAVLFFVSVRTFGLQILRKVY